jgi:hypothetical protein
MGEAEDIDETKDWSKEPPVSLLSRGTLANLAQLHFVDFTAKLANARTGAPGYRLDECESYQILWKNEVSRLGYREPPPMPSYTYNEYCDALFCGDYDQYLSTGELDALQRYAAEAG